MNGLLYVALGGALGASGRHLLSGLALRIMGPGYPYGTLAANVLGGLLIGFLLGWLMVKGTNVANGAENVRLFLSVGLLGGFTTFSAFSLDAMRMMETKAYGAAFGYISASVVFSILALFIGLVIARKLFEA